MKYVSLTIAELAAQMGVSYEAASSLLLFLRAKKLVVLTDFRTGTRGRPVHVWSVPETISLFVGAPVAVAEETTE